jgi:hypothetical protein
MICTNILIEIFFIKGTMKILGKLQLKALNVKNKIPIFLIC